MCAVHYKRNIFILMQCFSAMFLLSRANSLQHYVHFIQVIHLLRSFVEKRKKWIHELKL